MVAKQIVLHYLYLFQIVFNLYVNVVYKNSPLIRHCIFVLRIDYNKAKRSTPASSMWSSKLHFFVATLSFTIIGHWYATAVLHWEWIVTQGNVLHHSHLCQMVYYLSDIFFIVIILWYATDTENGLQTKQLSCTIFKLQLYVCNIYCVFAAAFLSVPFCWHAYRLP